MSAPPISPINLHKHGVSFSHAEQVFHDPLGFTIEDRMSTAKPLTTMRDEYDFSKAQRGPAVASPGKTRITIMLDDDVIEHFRAQAEADGTGYQTLINAVLRKVLREELAAPHG